jgi:hypothetical protein
MVRGFSSYFINFMTFLWLSVRSGDVPVEPNYFYLPYRSWHLLSSRLLCFVSNLQNEDDFFWDVAPCSPVEVY